LQIPFTTAAQTSIMKIKTSCLTTILFLCIVINANAQKEKTGQDEKPDPNLNFIKVNLTGIPLKNYSVQYERVIKRKMSFAIALRTMPSTGLPFKSAILDAVGTNDPDTKNTIEQLKLSNFAVTPELRFYLSKKGYGRGFYVAPFYRYASFSTNDMVFTYQNILNVSSTINLSGKLTSNTGGILLGSQWALGKHLCLDLWILGAHYGTAKGDFSGISSKPLTTEEQNDLRQQLNDIDIPLTNKTITVNAGGASMQLSGPWAGVRSGISLGVKF
jgi:hypothetical protein